MNEIDTGGEDVGREQTSQRLQERTDINHEKASLTAKHHEPTASVADYTVMKSSIHQASLKNFNIVYTFDNHLRIISSG